MATHCLVAFGANSMSWAHCFVFYPNLLLCGCGTTFLLFCCNWFQWIVIFHSLHISFDVITTLYVILLTVWSFVSLINQRVEFFGPSQWWNMRGTWLVRYEILLSSFNINYNTRKWTNWRNCDQIFRFFLLVLRLGKCRLEKRYDYWPSGNNWIGLKVNTVPFGFG